MQSFVAYCHGRVFRALASALIGGGGGGRVNIHIFCALFSDEPDIPTPS